MGYPRRDNGPVARAAVGKANNRQPDHSAGSMNEPAACQCRINDSGCLVCRRWAKVISAIEDRRAASLRRQALGQLARAGG